MTPASQDDLGPVASGVKPGGVTTPSPPGPPNPLCSLVRRRRDPRGVAREVGARISPTARSEHLVREMGW